MSPKSVKFKQLRPAPNETPADAWVTAASEERASKQEPAPPSEPMKRLTIDVPESLHRDFKSYCAQNGIKMADFIRDALSKARPAD